MNSSSIEFKYGRSVAEILFLLIIGGLLGYFFTVGIIRAQNQSTIAIVFALVSNLIFFYGLLVLRKRLSGNKIILSPDNLIIPAPGLVAQNLEFLYKEIQVIEDKTFSGRVILKIKHQKKIYTLDSLYFSEKKQFYQCMNQLQQKCAF